MSDQIQNISEEILEYKDKIFVKAFSKTLKANKAPFPENIAHYLNKLVMNMGVSPNVVMLRSVRKENNNYTVSLTGPFDSYVEINGIPTHFDNEGNITDFN